jgi:ribosome-associated protein
MADTVNSVSVRDLVLEVAHMLEDHKAEHTLVLQVGDVCSWTDYFIISTVRSGRHLASLNRELKNLFSAKGISAFHNSHSSFESGWVLLDFGNFVVHLMGPEQRAFYELEKLWFNGTVVYHSG